MNAFDLSPTGRILEVLDFLWDNWLVLLLAAFGVYMTIANLGNRATIASLQGEVASLEASAVTDDQALQVAVAAREAAEVIAAERLAILERERVEHARLREANATAIRAAQRAQVDAERTLRAFMDRYAQTIREPACGASLIQMEAACSALSDY